MSSEVKSVAPYDAIAPFYDRMYHNELSGRAGEAALVGALTDRFLPSTHSVLDLGSGTGTVLNQLAQTIILEDMVGVEQSAKMIHQARQNVPEAEFIQGDITDFDLGRQFDLVTCLFDTINHIPEPTGWERVFEQAAKHLKPGGIFMFDMATPYLLQGITQQDGYNWDFDGGRANLTMREVSPYQYKGEVEVITDDAPSETATLHITEATFDPRLVIRSLKKYLNPVRAFDYNKAVEMGDGQLPKVTEETAKIMIVSQKDV
ncbi:MAG TPA: class I SAM-dependent methyltransferase [Candidatus Saccharimonadales bacterium]